MRVLFGSVAAALLVIATSASASDIAGTGTPSSNAAFAGGPAVIDFESQGIGGYGSGFTTNGVTFGGTGQLVVDDFYAGQYNAEGRYLHNNEGSTSELAFGFAGPVAAFAFNFGASDVQWILRAFDASDNLLDSLTIDPTTQSNAHEYFGLAVVGIDHATLTSLNPAFGDYVFVDNFTYTRVGDGTGDVVPEPGTWALMIGGFGLTGLALRRRRALALA